MNRQPKIKAYMTQISTGMIKTNEAKIVNFLMNRPGGSNIEHMRSLLNMPHQTLTSRLSVLEDLGVVYKHGETRDGRHSNYRYEANPEIQNNLAFFRKAFKFKRWAKQGLKEYRDFLPTETINDIEFQLTT